MTIDRFEIAIDPPQNGVYAVRITTAAGEQATATLTLPQADADWEALLVKLAYRDRTTIFSEDEVIQLGQRLYDLLIRGKTAELFQSATSQATMAKRSLQLQLQLANHPELVPVAALPWEFLCDSQGHPLVTRYSLVRSLPHSAPIPPLTVDGPLTMLLAWALPAELIADYPLNIEAEVQSIQTQLQPLIDAQHLTLHVLPHATPLSLNRAIQDYQPHVLHLLGHGQAAISGAPQLVLETDDGAIQLISPRTLSVALQGSQVRLIVLNACHSGAQGARLFGAFGPALLTSSVPAVVGMQASVLDRAGRVFATELYRTLVKTGSVDHAVQQARKALVLTDVSQVDWGLATLYLRARDGVLFGNSGGNDDSPQPSLGGGAVFNQQGQQVGTQYNAQGDINIQKNTEISAGIADTWRKIQGKLKQNEIYVLPFSTFILIILSITVNVTRYLLYGPQYIPQSIEVIHKLVRSYAIVTLLISLIHARLLRKMYNYIPYKTWYIAIFLIYSLIFWHQINIWGAIYTITLWVPTSSFGEIHVSAMIITVNVVGAIYLTKRLTQRFQSDSTYAIHLQSWHVLFGGTCAGLYLLTLYPALTGIDFINPMLNYSVINGLMWVIALYVTFRTY